MKPLKEKISITIDNDILAKLKEQAEYDDRSLLPPAAAVGSLPKFSLASPVKIAIA